MLGGGGVKHGDILYDTDGQPAAVITGSWHSEGREPWNIRGRRVWIAVGLASKRAKNVTYCASPSISNYSCSVEIPTIEGPVINWKLATNNTLPDTNSSYVSINSTELHMDESFIYSNVVKNSEELTDAILAYISDMQAAWYCRRVILNNLGPMDLPSVDALMRIYQTRSSIDDIDPTASSNALKKMSVWGFASDKMFVFSASQYSSNLVISIGRDGFVTQGINKAERLGVIPVKEIPA